MAESKPEREPRERIDSSLQDMCPSVGNIFSKLSKAMKAKNSEATAHWQAPDTRWIIQKKNYLVQCIWK